VTVSRHVARRKVELGLDRAEVAVPQTHPPGAEAEVDFGEFCATIAGVWIKLWMFVMRLSHSGRAFHVAFATQAQEAFLQGHVLAFQHFGAVPARISPPSSACSRDVIARSRSGSSRCAPLRLRLVLLPPGQGRRARERRG
jgi:transposase